MLAEYRAKAKEARARATASTDVAAQKQLRQLAVTWEELANALEASLRR